MRWKRFFNIVLRALGMAKQKGWIDKSQGVDPKGYTKGYTKRYGSRDASRLSTTDARGRKKLVDE